MNNILRRDRSTLISLAQIEGGEDLLNRLITLQKLIEQIDLSQYRLKDHYIKEEDLDPNITRDIFNDVINSVLDKSGSLKTLDDILLDIQNIKIILDTCKKYNEPLSTAEIESLSESIILDLKKLIQLELDKERHYYEEQLYDLTYSIVNRLDDVLKDNEKISFQMGNTEDLHPFLLEALGPNNTVTDALNFLFQMIIDSKSYGEDLPTTKSDQVYPSVYEGKRVEYDKENLPEVFKLPNEMGKVGRYSQSNDIENLDDNDFGSISERIIYRKTLRKINEEDK